MYVCVCAGSLICKVDLSVCSSFPIGLLRERERERERQRETERETERERWCLLNYFICVHAVV